MTPRPVLFVPSNGTGMGHLVRQLATARRLDEQRFRPVFLCMSQVVPTLDQLGYAGENVMSRAYSTLGPHWHAYVEARLRRLLEALRPAVVVLDASSAYAGVLAALRAHPGVPLVWSRRAMWRAGSVRRDLLRSHRFAAVVEPGDLGEHRDPGPTTRLRRFTNRVGPITYLDAEELLDRQTARRELGVPAGHRAVLVTLGAGAVNDVASLRERVVESLLRRDDLTVVVTSPMIAREQVTSSRDRVRVVRTFPLARYLHAFDLGVAACGYNTAHEHLVGALPTVYLPNRALSRDDQAARAQAAVELGYAVMPATEMAADVDSALAVVDRPAELDRMRAACERDRQPNGARAAAEILTTLAEGGSVQHPGSRLETFRALDGATSPELWGRWGTRLRLRVKQDPHLRRALRQTPMTAADLLTGEGGDLGRRPTRVRGLSALGASDPTTAVAANGAKPLVLTDASDLRPWAAERIAVDHVMPEATWRSLSPDVAWPEYVRRRREDLGRLFGVPDEDWRPL